MNLKNNIYFLLAASLILAATTSAFPQASASPDRFSPQVQGYIERAKIMSDEGNYAGAIDQLTYISTENLQLSETQKEEFEFLLADALYNRGEEESVCLLRNFALQYPTSPKALEATLKIGDYYFFRHQWPKALTEYSILDFDRLDSEKQKLYYYRLALSQIKTGHFSEARKTLTHISHSRPYADAYDFYSAYLYYIEGKYDKAYSTFAKIKSKENGLDSRYYMVQIDYSRGLYKEVSEQGKYLLPKLKDSELAPELNRITGLSLFKLGNHESAQPYLATYCQSCSGTPAHDAVYALGVCDYERGSYSAAAEKFASLTELNNELAQSAWLYLGQCDIKTGNADAAAMAFEKAARMGLDREVSETALYNYAAALTHGGNVPFSSSVDMLEGFIKLYPDSEYTPKVEGYLATAYYNEKNYAKALENINKIRKPSNSVLAAKQKVLYQLGVEAMSNGKAKEAQTYFQNSLQLASFDHNLATQTQLWYGDALYANANFKKAESAYSSFIASEKPSYNKTLALYNLAYAQYQQDKYSKAAETFRKAIDSNPKLPNSILSDAYIRMGDCLYYSGAYRNAKTAYSKAISSDSPDSDYATYRHAVMLGLEGDIKGKIRELSEINEKYPDSKWLANALMEKALTFESLDRHSEAAQAFNQLATTFPGTMQARKAKLNLALSYAKAGSTSMAVETYKDIIRSWPSSEEADIANSDLRKYYSSTGGLSEYALFLKSIPGATQLNADQIEQLSFDAAETAFSDNSSNITLLNNYIKDYPDGKFLAQALLDIASSHKSNGHYSEAEATLDKLISTRPHSVQYPEALLLRGEILEKNLPGRKEDALKNYELLAASGFNDFLPDAYSGIARTADNAGKAVEFARKARNSGGLPGETMDEMSLIEAEALLKSLNETEALEILSSLSKNPNSEAGAKAAVRLGQYYLDKKQYSQAEKLMIEFTEQGTPHQFYLAKGFIVLADAYHGQKKNSLAKEYILSLKENYPGNEPEIKNAINSRLKSYK